MTHKIVINIFILHERKHEVQSEEVVNLGLEPGLSHCTSGEVSGWALDCLLGMHAHDVEFLGPHLYS